jgi:hypothetical protein
MNNTTITEKNIFTVHDSRNSLYITSKFCEQFRIFYNEELLDFWVLPTIIMVPVLKSRRNAYCMLVGKPFEKLKRLLWK